MTLDPRRLSVLALYGLALVALGLPLACTSTPTDPAIEPADEKRVNLMEGATWTYSIDDGATFTDETPTVATAGQTHFAARTEFEVTDLTGIEVLELVHKVPALSDYQFRLNGAEIPQPLKDMRYSAIPGLPPSLVKIGKNVLEADITWKGPERDTVDEKTKKYKCPVKSQLYGYGPGHLQMDVGPMLGAFGPDFFTVTCRTNMARAVRLDCLEGQRGEIATSPKGYYHRFQVKRDMTKHAPYLLDAGGGVTAEFQSPVYPAADKPFRMVILGDNRTNPKDWKKVAEAAAAQSPALVVHTGDFVGAGKDGALWPKEFYAPAKAILASAPIYPIFGNHEWEATILQEVFWTPGEDGKQPNWSQQVGDVLLVGLDGRLNWSEDGENYPWLAKTLAQSKAKYIFVFSHYPAYSSGRHGVEVFGKAWEKTARQARDLLVPLMVKHKVAAFFCGHDHFYERSELPGGLTEIITGGAGAPRYAKSKAAEDQNPYGKVFLSKTHFCVIDVQADKASLKALQPDGEEIDSLEFKPRN